MNSNSLITEEQLVAQGYPNTGRFLKGIYSLATRLSKMYGKYHLVEDFQQTAVAISAAKEKKYDSSRGASYYTFIAPSIQSAIFEQFGTAKKHTPIYKKISEFVNSFEETHKYYPDILQIAEGLGISIWKIKSIYVNDTPMEVPLEDEHLSVSEDVSKNETLESMIATLTTTQKDLVIRHFVNEESITDIAIATGMPDWLIEDELKVAKATLKQNLS